MKKYGVCVLIAGLLGVFQAIYFMQAFGEVYLSDIVLQFSFSTLPITLLYLFNMAFRMLPYFVFQILYGTVIYRRFCTASVYYFSRHTGRVRWFLSEALAVWPLAAVYVAIMAAVGTGVASLGNRIAVDGASVILCGYYVLIYSLWLWLTTLAMNVIAIKLGSGAGFALVAGLQVTLVALLELWEKVLPLEDSAYAARNAFLLQFNPIAHLVLAWHSSRIDSVNAAINMYSIHFDLNTSLILFAALNAAMLIIGCAVVMRHDLIVSNAETGGN